MSSTMKRNIILLIMLPIGLGLIAYATPLSAKYARVVYEILLFVQIVALAVVLPDRWRKSVVPVASIIFCLFVAEFFIAFFSKANGGEPPGFSVSRPELGWGPAAPGIYRSLKTSRDGSIIYDVNYTIDQNLLRRTDSATDGPTVAFFGDSMSFGQGLPDSDALPQAFANLSGGGLRVLNLAFPGYGPQQFLRALETGMFDHLLKDVKVFVFQAAAWQAERASCRASYMTRAPRYELRNGELAYAGVCAEGLRRIYTEFVLGSAFYQNLIAPRLPGVDGSDVEMFIAQLVRCARVVKEKYGARLVVPYFAESASYLAKTGFTDVMIEDNLRQKGVDVLDDTVLPKDFPPGSVLTIPGDGHPTAVVARAWAAILQRHLASFEPPLTNAAK